MSEDYEIIEEKWETMPDGSVHISRLVRSRATCGRFVISLTAGSGVVEIITSPTDAV